MVEVAKDSSSLSPPIVPRHSEGGVGCLGEMLPPNSASHASSENASPAKKKAKKKKAVGDKKAGDKVVCSLPA